MTQPQRSTEVVQKKLALAQANINVTWTHSKNSPDHPLHNWTAFRRGQRGPFPWYLDVPLWQTLFITYVSFITWPGWRDRRGDGLILGIIHISEEEFKNQRRQIDCFSVCRLIQTRPQKLTGWFQKQQRREMIIKTKEYPTEKNSKARET